MRQGFEEYNLPEVVLCFFSTYAMKDMVTEAKIVMRVLLKYIFSVQEYVDELTGRVLRCGDFFDYDRLMASSSRVSLTISAVP